MGRDDFRLNRPRIGKKARIGLPRFPQHRAAAIHDRGVFAMDERDAASVLGDPHGGQERLHIAIEVVERQKELDRRMPRLVERPDRGQVFLGRAQEHGMEKVVADRERLCLGIIDHDPVRHRAVAGSEAHVADRRNPARNGRLRPRLEIVRPVELRIAANGIGQVCMRVHAARRDDPPGRVDFDPVLGQRHLAAKLCHDARPNADIDDRASADGNDGPAANDRIHRLGHGRSTLVCLAMVGVVGWWREGWVAWDGGSLGR